ncbi:hypothetical protein FHS16_001346 [Paenibacillus endophyticus]|uniref:Uncharacterized protein n=1 Tax=Paenibacillus endophyticus TaxID=1294268 RepID=A0A7W5C5A0_9BACL|nr:hypothetical protein [Paenibacillus endophyticus]MBB3151303.1 hypothetical protein [Paenibacillus endophyticus]
MQRRRPFAWLWLLHFARNRLFAENGQLLLKVANADFEEVMLDYELLPNENLLKSFFTALLIKLTLIKHAKFDADSGKVVFDAKQAGKYAAVYKPVAFTDLSKLAWA